MNSRGLRSLQFSTPKPRPGEHSLRGFSTVELLSGARLLRVGSLGDLLRLIPKRSLGRTSTDGLPDPAIISWYGDDLPLASLTGATAFFDGPPISVTLDRVAGDSVRWSSSLVCLTSETILPSSGGVSDLSTVHCTDCSSGGVCGPLTTLFSLGGGV